MFKFDNQALEFSAGAYEIFKTELLNYYNQCADRKCILEHKKKEKSGLITEHSHSIKHLITGQGEDLVLGRQICKISLFHTNCKVLINRRGYRSFMNEDLSKILISLDGVDDLKSINARIKEACHSYLLSANSKPSKKNATTIGSAENHTDNVSVLSVTKPDQNSLSLGDDLLVPQGSCRVAQNPVEGWGRGD